MRRLIAINVAIAALLVLVPLLALELYLRAMVPSSSNESIFTYTLDTKRYKLMKANAAVTAWGKELRTNEFGFRDRPIGPKKPGERRMVVLGDSFTVSAGVDFEDIYTARLEKKLGARVLNLAVGGYNVVQYALVLQEVGLGLQPDLVVVALFPDNDFSNDTYETNFQVASAKASVEPERTWYEELYVYRAYGTRLQNKVKSLFPAAKAPAGGNAREEGPAWQENVAALGTIARITAERGIPLKVIILPHTWNFEKQRPLFARVQKECDRLALTCLNLLESFIARGVPEASLRLNALDAHPNERYNEIVADEVGKFLKKKAPLLVTRYFPGT